MWIRIIKYVVLSLIAALLAGCNNEKDVEPDAPTPQIVFLFSPGGLGDMSYNDCILQGIQNFKKQHPEVDVFMSSPGSTEEAERIFSDWIKRPGSNIPVLFVLASSDYESLTDRYIDDGPLADNKRLLLFETSRRYSDPHIYTFQISMYGASYLAGVAAAELCGEKKSLVLLGSSSDKPIQSARDGFIAGCTDSSGQYPDVEYLSDSWTGFVMPSFTYQKMPEWSSAYGFVFPVAGGSNAGIYRYSRENEDAPFLAGMDVDQSGFSNKITGSVVKHFEILLPEYLEQWLATGTMPESTVYGLESGYSDWVSAPDYAARLSDTVNKKREDAIANEKKYNENNIN